MSMIVKSGFRYANSIPDAFLIPAVDSDGRSSSVQTELNKLYGAIEIKNFNVGANHNGIYRGATLVDTVDGNGRYTLSELYAMVSQGDFSDIYIGDIIKVNQAAVTYTPAGGSKTTDPAQVVEWIVMGIDTYFNLGPSSDPTLAHHIVLGPRKSFSTNAPHMNSTNTTVGAYNRCDMFTNILPAYKDSIKASLGGHVLTYKDVVSTSMEEELTSSISPYYKGVSVNWDWVDATINLFSEQDVSGNLMTGLYERKINSSQLPGFRLNSSLKNKTGSNSTAGGWWLNNVATKDRFLVCSNTGNINIVPASSSEYGLAPKILFG